jgi:hypothetical protein
MNVAMETTSATIQGFTPGLAALFESGGYELCESIAEIEKVGILL